MGCHESKALAPTSTPGLLALMREPSIPAPPPWGVRPLNFLRDVQPVFDRHCVRCHGGLTPAAELDFTGGLNTGLRFQTRDGRNLGLDGHNTAYRTLITRGLVAYSNKSDPADALSQPLAFGSHRSRLIAALREGPCARESSWNPTSGCGWSPGSTPMLLTTVTSSIRGPSSRLTTCPPTRN